jgi:predicted metalloendopeptidase
VLLLNSVSGTGTLDENIGNHVEFAISYTAPGNTPEGKNIEPIDGFTLGQRFFLSFSQL